MSNTLTALILWVHLGAIVTWLGLIVNSALVFFPSIDSVTPAERTVLLTSYRKRALGVSLGAVLVLLVVGTIMVVTNPSFKGIFPLFGTMWDTLIAVKHTLVGAMIVLQGIAVFRVQPQIIRSLNAPVGSSDPKQQNQVLRLSRLNRGLAILTGVAGLGVLLIISFVVTSY